MRINSIGAATEAQMRWRRYAAQIYANMSWKRESQSRNAISAPKMQCKRDRLLRTLSEERELPISLFLLTAILIWESEFRSSTIRNTQ